MGNRKRIVIRAYDDGSIQLEADGYKGQSCQEATKFLSKVLGKTTAMEKKAEWWLRNGKSVRQVREDFNIKTEKLCG